MYNERGGRAKVAALVVFIFWPSMKLGVLILIELALIKNKRVDDSSSCKKGSGENKIDTSFIICHLLLLLSDEITAIKSGLRSQIFDIVDTFSKVLFLISNLFFAQDFQKWV